MPFLASTSVLVLPSRVIVIIRPLAFGPKKTVMFSPGMTLCGQQYAPRISWLVSCGKPHLQPVWRY